MADHMLMPWFDQTTTSKFGVPTNGPSAVQSTSYLPVAVISADDHPLTDLSLLVVARTPRRRGDLGANVPVTDRQTGNIDDAPLHFVGVTDGGGCRTIGRRRALTTIRATDGVLQLDANYRDTKPGTPLYVARGDNKALRLTAVPPSQETAIELQAAGTGRVPADVLRHALTIVASVTACDTDGDYAQLLTVALTAIGAPVGADAEQLSRTHAPTVLAESVNMAAAELAQPRARAAGGRRAPPAPTLHQRAAQQYHAMHVAPGPPEKRLLVASPGQHRLLVSVHPAAGRQRVINTQQWPQMTKAQLTATLLLEAARSVVDLQQVAGFCPASAARHFPDKYFNMSEAARQGILSQYPPMLAAVMPWVLHDCDAYTGMYDGAALPRRVQHHYEMPLAAYHTDALCNRMDWVVRRVALVATAQLIVDDGVAMFARAQHAAMSDLASYVGVALVAEDNQMIVAVA